MVGFTRSEKAKLEKEEREIAENMVWKVLIITDTTTSWDSKLTKFPKGEATKGGCNDRQRPGCGLQHARAGAERSSSSVESVLGAGPGGDVPANRMYADV